MTRPHRRHIVGAVLWLAATFPCAVSAHGAVRYDNGYWWNGTGFVAKTMVSSEGIFLDDPADEADGVVDLEGRYVVPAFADAHTHALGDPRFEAQRDRLLAQGVFYAANPNSIAKLTEAVRPHVNVAGSVDVIYANGGITGPGGHPIQIYDRIASHLDGWTKEDMAEQAYFVVDSEQDLERSWPRILAGKPDFVKVYLEYSEHHDARRADPAFYGRRGLDPRLLPAVVGRARAADLRVAVHVSSRADVETAVLAGADAIAHLPLERLTPEIAEQAARSGTAFVTTVFSHRPTDHVPDLEAVHRFNLRLLKEHGVALVLGTDGDRSLLDEAAEVARLGGLTPAEAVNLATRETPRWIFPERRIGALENNFEATFLVLAGNPLEDLGALKHVHRRIQRGREIEVKAAAGKPSIAQEIAGPLMHQGLEAAVARYRRLRTEEPDAWDFSEPQLNALGYQLLHHDRVDLAIAIFELNVEIYPRSANVYDSLGEAFMHSGKTEEAIRNYRRSLELDPANHNAVEKLQSLSKAPAE